MILPLLYVLLTLFRVGSFRFIKFSLPQSLTADGAWTRSRSSPGVKEGTLFRVGSFRFIKRSLPQSLTADGVWTRSRSSPGVKDQGGESYSSVNFSALYN